MNFLNTLPEEHVKLFLQAAREISDASNSGRKLHFLSPKELEEISKELESELSKRNNADADDTTAE